MQLYTVGSLLVALFGVVVLVQGFVLFSPGIAIGMGLGGAAAAVGAVHLRRALSATDGERAESRSAAKAPAEDESASGRDPISTLKERYARGDIDDAEFERRVGLLLEVDSGESDASGSGRQDEVRARER